ncbi:FkbM family methyltransferase [Actinoallomurus purpureus]|uniref:FkbM family methyltransferase n=1 Tax=Actinoallomurus purpureus TaxID=478114 RepID=UPI0020925C75|nr:FkbM family methyltransferase [Actinoallomurus purpureus]MCO6008542.1 FkbM family methyltransferase [Actinoallomurus purpureus]
MVYKFGCSANGDDVATVYCGLSLTGPARDFSIIHQLFAGYYEEVEVALFERLATHSNMIIDIGANIGLYSCVGAANLPEGGHLVAFEPVPENVAYLRGNITRNGLLEKVTVEAAAVGDKIGSVTIYLARGIGHHSIGADNALGWSSSTSVPVVSLDSYLADHEIGPPDLIKIDAEGYDGFVLRGAHKTLSLSPTLLIEYSPHGLANCGFSPHELLDVIFANYRHVFLVHEIKMRACTKQDVLRLGTKDGLGANLLATNNDDHLAIANMMLDAHASHA